MYIITINGKEKDGAYSVIDDDGEQVVGYRTDDRPLEQCHDNDDGQQVHEGVSQVPGKYLQAFFHREIIAKRTSAWAIF